MPWPAPYCLTGNGEAPLRREEERRGVNRASGKITMPEDDALSCRKENIGNKIDFQTNVFDGSIMKNNVNIYRTI